MAEILDGLKVSKEIKQEIKAEVEKILANKRRAPHLVAILVGNNGASKAYVNAKVKDCEEVGFQSSLIKFPSTVSESELLEKIDELNKSKAVDGFIVQLPLPDQIDQEKIINAIDPRKDVDGFHPENFGKMALEMDTFLPATPLEF
jgi:methylenetetrahydrofolate dehydrogenase (NADP+)/methenyltetrahydrofolate cyclohydrolase